MFHYIFNIFDKTLLSIWEKQIYLVNKIVTMKDKNINNNIQNQFDK